MTIVLLCAAAWMAVSVVVVALCVAARLGDEARPLIGRPQRPQRRADADPGFVLTIAPAPVRGVARHVTPQAHARR